MVNSVTLDSREAQGIRCLGGVRGRQLESGRWIKYPSICLLPKSEWSTGGSPRLDLRVLGFSLAFTPDELYNFGQSLLVPSFLIYNVRWLD